MFLYLQTNDKDIEVSRVWKSRPSTSPVRSETAHTGFKRWRRNNALKPPKVAVNGTNALPPEKCKEEMSLLKFLALVS